MRQRKVKNEKERLETLEHLAIKNSQELPEDFAGDLYLELGCGRGHFINYLAKNRPNDFFIGVEGRSSIVLRAMELTHENKLDNILFIPEFINKMEDYFNEGELAGIYLNFSDPWPKTRHEKRRLTHKNYLEAYRKALRPGAFIEFKTDSQGLFDFTLNQCDILGIKVGEVSRDLHKSNYPSKENITQYEKRFMLLDQAIYYCKMFV